ncbi:MAG: hypothetical protein WCZ19_01800 [Acholeplasma sp.]
MDKFKKIMAIISIVLSLMLVWIMIDFMIAYNATNDGWIILGYLLIAIIMGIVTTVLTIPFIYVLIKQKYQNMKLYFYAHIALVLLSIGSVILAVALS